MRARRSSLVGGAGALALVAGLVVGLPTAAQAAVSPSAAVVINEVYGGGGNAGSTYKRDFVELYNAASATVDLSSWSVQYASATGGTWQVTDLVGSLPAGGLYVVGEGSGGTNGTTDVPFDVDGVIQMAAGRARSLWSATRPRLACTTGCTTLAPVVDFVGYGTTASDFAGAGACAGPQRHPGDHAQREPRQHGQQQRRLRDRGPDSGGLRDRVHPAAAGRGAERHLDDAGRRRIGRLRVGGPHGDLLRVGRDGRRCVHA